VAASFYPLAWVAQTVGGDAVSVTNLTPPGVEPHELELDTKGRAAIDDAAVVLVMGSGFQPVVEKAAKDRSAQTLEVLAALPIDAQGKSVEAHNHSEGDGHDHRDDKKTGSKNASASETALDPHVWLDPVLMSSVVDVVTQRLSTASPANQGAFEERATALKQQLVELDGRYRTGLATCAARVVVTNHEAFGYLTSRYNLEEIAVSGLAPDAEPSPSRLAEISKLVKDKGVTTVFTEELASPKVAQALASEAGARTAELSPIEGIPDDELATGANYLTKMDANLAALQNGLECTR